MTEVPPPEPTEQPVDWRGGLHRLLRRQRRAAQRHALIGVGVSAALVLGLHLLTDPGRASADIEPPSGGTAFSAAMVGDVMFGRHVERVAERRGYDSLLEHVDPLLDADYVSANLEQVVAEDPDQLPQADKLIHLASGPEPLEALADVGVNTVTLANNHTMDYGVPGLVETIDAVEDAGFDHAGAGEDLAAAQEPVIAEHGDLTVATLSFTDAFVEGFPARAFQGGVLDADVGVMVRLVQAAAAEADLVIAQFHWGAEYDVGPNVDQREIAEFAVEAGADLVVGHHPHVLMPVERIDDSLVFWSLGNFVFDQGWSRTRESAVARYELDEDGTARVVMSPVWIREGTPRPLTGLTSLYRRGRIYQQLRGDGLEWVRDGDALVAELDHSHLLGGDDG